MRRRFTQQQLRGRKLWWIVSLDFGGRVWHVAQAQLEIEDPDSSRWIATNAGLDDAETLLSAPWMGSEPETRSASVAITLPDLDVGLLLSRGYELDAAPLEVAVWREGDQWPDRMVVLRGSVVSYEWGAAGEELRIEAQEVVDEDRAQLPPPAAVVSAATWPSAPESAMGRAYPWILGNPGSVLLAAAPALFVESTADGGARDLLLVAGHPVSSTSVAVTDGEAIESLAVEHVQDDVGRLVAVVDLAGASTIAVDTSLDYATGWTGGGLPGVSGTPALGAGSIIEAVLATSTLPIDRGSLASVRSRLDAYKIGAYIEEPTSPLAWVADALLPLLPVSVVTGPAGWRIIPALLEATEADTIATLTASPSVIRDGAVSLEGRDTIATHIELRYAVEAVSGETTATAIAGVEAGEHTSLATRKAAGVYGRRVRSEESVAVYDDATAIRIVRWLAAANAFPRQSVSYTGPFLHWLQPGDLVWLDDASLFISRVAVVEQVRMAPEECSVKLVLWRQPC